MNLYEIKPLLSDMRKNHAKVDKFKFIYNKVDFEVIVLIDRTPFELLFGVIDHNFSFALKLRKGFILDGMSDDVFYKLCDILKLKPSKQTFTSFMFLKYVAKQIPRTYSKVKIQPHEIGKYKTDKVAESDKIYFKGWITHTNDGKEARNFEKTKEFLGDEAYIYCVENNISSRWGVKPTERVDYYPPQQYKYKK